MKNTTVKENREFKRIYRKGKSIISPELITYVIKNRTKDVKYGITASKKIGSAVERNRARRVIREAYYNLSDSITNGYNIIFIARTKTIKLKSTDIKEKMQTHLKELGILKL